MSGADAEDASKLGGVSTGHEETNFVGAVYGSLLAASVVAGTSPRDGAPSLFELCTLLMVTGLVFWAAHVYARLIGEAVLDGEISWGEVRSVARHEWPLVEAAVAPCLVATGFTVLGAAASTAAWAALITAIAGQVTWAVNVTLRAGAPRALVVLSGAANLALGLVLVGLKAALTH
jgi:hypothetical protein